MLNPTYHTNKEPLYYILIFWVNIAFKWHFSTIDNKYLFNNNGSEFQLSLHLSYIHPNSPCVQSKIQLAARRKRLLGLHVRVCKKAVSLNARKLLLTASRRGCAQKINLLAGFSRPGAIPFTRNCGKKRHWLRQVRAQTQFFAQNLAPSGLICRGGARSLRNFWTLNDRANCLAHRGSQFRGV